MSYCLDSDCKKFKILLVNNPVICVILYLNFKSGLYNVVLTLVLLTECSKNAGKNKPLNVSTETSLERVGIY